VKEEGRRRRRRMRRMRRRRKVKSNEFAGGQGTPVKWRGRARRLGDSLVYTSLTLGD
jgi:hypothetical protein